MRRTCLFILILTVTSICTAGVANSKIVVINSYHEGYVWSDGVIDGVKRTLEPHGISVRVLHMDSKRNPSDDHLLKVAHDIMVEIESWSPDVIIASDDNACRYIIAPYYNGDDTPVVFCGVNWDASEYNFTRRNITGMIEVAHFMPLVLKLKRYALGERIGFISVDLITEHKEANQYRNKFNLPISERFVSSMAEWKSAYLEFQKSADLLIVGNHVGINDWDAEEMKEFMLDNAAIPSGTLLDWMASYALVGFVRRPEEQGEWAAETAIRILEGDAPITIPFSQNIDGQLLLNPRYAEKLGVEFTESDLEKAIIVY